MINKKRLKASNFLCDGFAGLIDINDSISAHKLHNSIGKDIFSRICDMNNEIYNEITENLSNALNQYEQRKSRETRKKNSE